MQLSSSRVLVIGGAGFIGSHLVEAVAARGAAHLAVMDTLWLGRRANLDDATRLCPELAFYQEDAAEFPALVSVIERVRPDIVFNLATKPLNYSFVNPRGAYMVNVDIAANLAELQRGGAFGALVQFSTSEVYGDARRAPMDEEHPCHPTTPYAAGKLAADLLLRSYRELFGIRVLTVRPFNNYGPRQNAGDYAAVIPLTIRRILSGQAPVLEGDGHQTRDFTFVTDTARLALELVEQGDAWGREINVAAGEELQIGALIATICETLGYRGPIDRRPVRAGDHRRHVAGVALLRSLLPGASTTPAAQGIAETVAWYQRGGQGA
ncbi:MAG: NAD-dependent epimerase/dehydratase family protein [Vicinamibacterales bacterium]